MNLEWRQWRPRYDLLGLTFDVDVARGFPVLEAAVAYPAEGYGAFLGWIQVVRYQVAGDTEAVTIVDVPPQMKDAGVPYAAFGEWGYVVEGDRPFQANSWARLRKTGRSYSRCYAPTT